MGQKHRVVLAALLAMGPDVLLLDEPFSQLDAAGEARLREVIAALRRGSVRLSSTTHAVDSGDPLWDVCLELPAKTCCNLQLLSPQASPFTPQVSGHRESPVLMAQGLGLSWNPGPWCSRRSIRHGGAVRPSSFVAVTLSGKSTLLRCLAGILRPSAGPVFYRRQACNPNPGVWRPARYLPQNADMLLFEESVRREVGFTLRR